MATTTLLAARVVLLVGRVVPSFDPLPEAGTGAAADAAAAVAEAVALDRVTGRVVAVGTRANVEAAVAQHVGGGGGAAAADAVEVVELPAGAVACPAFCDAHGHLFHHGMNMTAMVALQGIASAEEAVALLKARVARDCGGAAAGAGADAADDADAASAGAGSHDDAAPAYWLRAGGWDETRWPGEGWSPARVRELLDAEFADVPVWAGRVDYHCSVLNAAGERALRAAAAAVAAAGGDAGAIARTEDALAGASVPGVYMEDAQARISDLLPRHSRQARLRGLAAAVDDCARHGITQVHDACLSRTQHEMLERAISETGRLRSLRIHGMVGSGVRAALDHVLERGPKAFTLPPVSSASTTTTTTTPGDTTVRLRVSAVKFFADGALGSRGAAMLEPYRGCGGSGVGVDADDEGGKAGGALHPRGTLLLQPAELLRDVRACFKAGLQPCTHAIGDHANRVVLDAYAEALRLEAGAAAAGTAGEGEDGGDKEKAAAAAAAAVAAAADVMAVAERLRPRVEHAQLLDPQDAARFASLGVIASMQPLHCANDCRWIEQVVEAPRPLEGAYAWRTLADSGARLAFGSDFPVESLDVLDGVTAASDGRTWRPEQRLTRREALAAFTRGAAYASFDEDERGALAPGFVADVVILSSDPERELEEQDEEQTTITTTTTTTTSRAKPQVLATICGGHATFCHEGTTALPAWMAADAAAMRRALEAEAADDP